MAITDEQYQAARGKNARAKKISLDVCGEAVEIVARPATRTEWKNYKALANNADENKSASANEQLVIFCTLEPDPKTPEFASLLDRYPAAADVISSKIKEISGLSLKVELDLLNRS
jgi:hypothetical protein